MNRDKPFNAKRLGSYTYSAYITYSTEIEAALAIVSVRDYHFEGSVIRTSYGTTKYCCYYLRKKGCQVKNCLYMHSEANKCDILSEETSMMKDLFFYLQKNVMAWLGKRANQVLNLSFKEPDCPKLPTVKEAL